MGDACLGNRLSDPNQKKRQINASFSSWISWMAVSSGPLDSSKRDWREIGDSSKVDR